MAAKKKGSRGRGRQQQQQQQRSSGPAPDPERNAKPERVANPFAGGTAVAPASHAMGVEQSRVVAQVQAAIVAAKASPRDEAVATDRILDACARVGVAEVAEYAYPRGDTLVQGPSIRLAEVMARAWGNMEFGITELSRQLGSSTMLAYATDLQTNTHARREFIVDHVRERQSGNVTLTGSRDIYELTANQGARRLRACILELLPSELIDAARRQCALTLEQNMGAKEDQVDKLVKAFAELGVTVEHLEAFLGHDLGATVTREIIRLRRAYTSISEGFATAADIFKTAPAAGDDAKPEKPEKSGVEGMKEDLAPKGDEQPPAEGGDDDAEPGPGDEGGNTQADEGVTEAGATPDQGGTEAAPSSGDDSGQADAFGGDPAPTYEDVEGLLEKSATADDLDAVQDLLRDARGKDGAVDEETVDRIKAAIAERRAAL